MQKMVLFGVLLLAGCGPGVTVTDVDATTTAQLQSVRVIQGDVPASARPLGPVDATSCKNKAWDPPPTDTNAILQMKVVAQRKGGNAIGNVYCEPPLGTSLGNNCWSSIRCTATAFSVPN